ncbi:MAG TPA: hypothetical protein H9884_02945 [Candidatus Yaniella excrementigallinarum]|nr:hypothetical protein [Candidatus Yaniella excrementigallinarum]
MFVVKMTQRATEPTEQNLQALQQDFAQRLGADFPVTRAADPTVYHSAVESSQQVVAMALHAMRLGLWHVGIGVGGAAENGNGKLEGSGVKAADLAVSLASKQGQLVPLRIEAAKPPRGVNPTQLSKHAQSVLQLLGHVVSRRSTAEWAVLDRLVPGVRGQQRHVAQELDMTVQAVSQAVKRSLYNTEHDVRAAVSLLLDQTDAAVSIQANSGLS